MMLQSNREDMSHSDRSENSKEDLLSAKIKSRRQSGIFIGLYGLENLKNEKNESSVSFKNSSFSKFVK